MKQSFWLCQILAIILSFFLFFKNKYSIWYGKDDQIWQEMPAQPELPESKYQDFISKAQLAEQVSNLFIQYQQDWTIIPNKCLLYL